MSQVVNVKWDQSGVAALRNLLETERIKAAFDKALPRAVRKAGSTALRDMRAEASKRVRAMKKIGLSYIRDALGIRMAKGNTEFSLEIGGKPVPLVAYPHRQTKKGVSFEMNRGKRTVVAGSFLATMRSGHKGVFKRKGAGRLPIVELLGSRPVDALSHKGELEGVVERGAKSFLDTLLRVLPLEIGK